MHASLNPRLSQVRTVLSRLRSHLGAAAAHYSLPASLEVELLPIVEDGLLAYELLPNHDTHTYLTIGANVDDAPVVRKNLYCAASPSALRLATINGRSLLPHELEAWDDIEQQDSIYPDWPSAAAAIWSELVALFADEPRYPIAIDDQRHAAFDESLAIAQAYLGDCDPCIDFCGLADEAQYGFVLKGDSEEHGQLILRTRGCWELRWTTRTASIQEEWPETPAIGAPRGWASGVEPGAMTFHVPIKRAAPGISTRRRR